VVDPALGASRNKGFTLRTSDRYDADSEWATADDDDDDDDDDAVAAGLDWP
jgi:hypothetical protein